MDTTQSLAELTATANLAAGMFIMLGELRDMGFDLRHGPKSDEFIRLCHSDPFAARAYLLGNPDILVQREDTLKN